MLIALPVNKAGAMKSHWFRVKIAFNLKQDEITLKIHDQEKYARVWHLPMSSARK